MFILKTIEEYEELLKNGPYNGTKFKELYDALLQEYKQACSMLNAYGVTNERAKTLANGIDVLATRFRKEINYILQEYPIKVEADFKTFEETLGNDEVYITFSVDKTSQLIPALLSTIHDKNLKVCISTEKNPTKDEA